LARARFDRLATPAGRTHSIARLGVVVCLVLAAAVGLVYFAKAVDALGDAAAANAVANYDDRELAGGTALGVDQEALVAARGLIPEGETYRLVVGPQATNIGQFTRYFLMPRRPAKDARWVVCYECDLSRFGGELHVLWQSDAGVAVGRLPG